MLGPGEAEGADVVADAVAAGGELGGKRAAEQAAEEAYARAADSDEGDAATVGLDYKPPRNWRKSLSNFFRTQPRSTKSNDGDHLSSLSHDGGEEKEISPEQKWQSLGKIFRRQSLVDNWGRSPEYRNQHGESSTQSKRLGLKKMFTNYFQKNASSSNMVAKDDGNM